MHKLKGYSEAIMNAYIYRAALYCEPCALPIAVECYTGTLDLPTAYDSDVRPQGPYPDGGGEADTPQHCDACGVFLENPLTTDGREYVRTELELDSLGIRRVDRNQTTRTWADFYAIS